MKYLAAVIVLALSACTSLPNLSSSDSRISADSYFVLGEIALEDGRLADAATNLLAAAELSSNPALAEKAARLAEQAGLTETGLNAAARWAELMPNDDRPIWYRGIFHTRTGNLEAAIDDFDAVIGGLPDDSRGSGLALVYEALGNEPNSAAGTYVMRELVSGYPGHAEGHYALARLALRSGNFPLSLEHARETARIEPDWLDAQLLLARSLLVSGNSAEALSLAEALTEDNPNDEVRLQYAELMLSAGQSADAETMLNDILQDNPEMIEATRALAFLRLQQDDLDGAQLLFEQLRTNAAYQNEAFYYLGRIAESDENELLATRSYARVTEGIHVVESQLRIARIMFEQTGEQDIALEHLREFGKENSMFATEMIVARSEILMQSGQTDTALDLITESLEQSPSDTVLQRAHVQIFTSLAADAGANGDYHGAHQILNDGLDEYPGDTSLRYSQSLLLEDQGRPRRAASILAELVEEQPDNSALLNAYGYLLTDQFDRHSEAQAYISRALAMDPDNPAIIDSMGWVLFKQGDFHAALDYLERAYRLYNDPEVIAHLIDTHWQLGNRDTAGKLLEQGLSEFPSSRHLLEVRDRLEL